MLESLPRSVVDGGLSFASGSGEAAAGSGRMFPRSSGFLFLATSRHRLSEATRHLTPRSSRRGPVRWCVLGKLHEREAGTERAAPA